MQKRGQLKIGVYIDVSNIAQNGGYGMHYDQLREYACRNHGTAMRLNAYIAYDEEKARLNPDYRAKTENYHSMLREFGYKVIVKKVKWYMDEFNNRFGKANADLDMAVDILSQSDKLDYVLLATGDGDFVQVIKALQSKGCRVEVLAFKNVSGEIRTEADVFTSGYLVPDLIPTDNEYFGKTWGEIGSRVRGVCYNWFHDKGYGFIRFLKHLEGDLYVLDTRKPESPYETVFVHETQISNIVDVHTLPNRDVIFEFTLEKNEKGTQAIELKVAYKY
jgi:uncharacterized LabA/DUF88 family protein/cold shock CspA family protein